MKKIFTIALMSCMAASAWGQQTDSSPQGEKKEYVKTFSGCFYSANQEEFEGREKNATIIWGEDNDVYFPDMISMLPMGSVAKGVLDGDRITVAVPQTVHHQVEDYGFMVFELDYNLVLLKESEANGMKTYTPIKDEGAFTFTLASDGTVVLDPLDEGYALGLTQDNGHGEAWYGAAEYSMVYTPKTSALDIRDADQAQAVDETYFDLSGRPTSKSTKGIVIKQTLLNDGTIKTQKTLKK